MRGGAVAARRAHNPEVLGSNPSPAILKQNPSNTWADFILEVLVEEHQNPSPAT
jgi:hypothetical protein